MKYLSFTISVISLSLVISSCSNNNSSKKAADAVDNIIVDEIATSIENVPMPTSYETIELLNRSGAGYIFDITNPPTNINNYLTYRQKAINLGIYAADLTYTSTYNKKDETAQYLDNFITLVESLEINTLDNVFFENLQNNLNNRDSLVIIVNKAQDDTYAFLNESGQKKLALYALTGSFIEGLHLVNATIRFASNKQPLYSILIKNKKTINDLITLMKPYEGDKGFKDLYSSLSDINKLFIKLDKNNKDMKTIKKLKNKIVELRTSLISIDL